MDLFRTLFGLLPHFLFLNDGINIHFFLCYFYNPILNIHLNFIDDLIGHFFDHLLVLGT